MYPSCLGCMEIVPCGCVFFPSRIMVHIDRVVREKVNVHNVNERSLFCTNFSRTVVFVPHLLMIIMHPPDPGDLCTLIAALHAPMTINVLILYGQYAMSMIRRCTGVPAHLRIILIICKSYSLHVSHKLKALLASSLNCKRLSIITVEGCGLTIAHA